jgi:hypothetical protein
MRHELKLQPSGGTRSRSARRRCGCRHPQKRVCSRLSQTCGEYAVAIEFASQTSISQQQLLCLPLPEFLSLVCGIPLVRETVDELRVCTALRIAVSSPIFRFTFFWAVRHPYPAFRTRYPQRFHTSTVNVHCLPTTFEISSIFSPLVWRSGAGRTRHRLRSTLALKTVPAGGGNIHQVKCRSPPEFEAIGGVPLTIEKTGPQFVGSSPRFHRPPWESPFSAAF